MPHDDEFQEEDFVHEDSDPEEEAKPLTLEEMAVVDPGVPRESIKTIGDGAVTTSKLAGNSIATGTISANAITNAKIVTNIEEDPNG